MSITGTRGLDLTNAARVWREHGWVLLPGLVPTGEIDAAAHDLWAMYPPPATFHAGDPDPRTDAFRTRRDPDFRLPTEPPSGPAFRVDQFLGTRTFPFPGSGLLNRLAVHPHIVGFARAALATDDIRLYQAQAWAKYTGVVDYEQPLHCDRNHSLIPTLTAGPLAVMEGFLYLSDVTEEDGPALITSHEDGTEVAATGPRGSYLAYRPDVWHRGSNLTSPNGSRFVGVFAFRRAEAEWVGYNTFGNLAPNAHFRRFAAACSPDELSLFGIPRPGHPIWTGAMIDGLADMYPGLDTTPWRDAARVCQATKP